MNIILKTIFIFLIIIEILIFITKKEKHKIIMSDTFWILVPWSICLGLYYILGIEYFVELSISTLLYIILFWIMYFIGKFIGQVIYNYRFKKNIERIEESKYHIKLDTKPLFWLSVSSTIIYVVYMLSINNIVFGVTRNINTNSIATVLLMISNVSLVIWLYELAYALLNEKKITYMGWGSVILYNIPGLIISGRDALIICIISSISVFIYCGYFAKFELKKSAKSFNKLKKVIVIVAVILICYLVFLSANRYGEKDDSAINLFQYSANCVFPEYLRKIYYEFGGIGKLFLNAVFYYSSQFSKLEIIVSSYEGPNIMGFYQLHYISRILPSSLGLDYVLVTDEIGRLTSMMNVPGLKNFWHTVIGEFIFDFGKIGALIASFVIGIIIRIIQINCRKKKDIYSILIDSFIIVAMFITIQISPIFDYYYVFPLIWLILIVNVKKKRIIRNDENVDKK